MKNKIIITAIISILTCNIYSQQAVFSNKMFIDNTAEIIHTGDINTDGNTDLIFYSQAQDSLYWYKNNGNGTFNNKQSLGNIIIDTMSVINYNTDVDNDGDIDFIIVKEVYFSPNYYTIMSWYENTDGLGTYGPEQIIDTLSNSWVPSIITTDINGDNHKDIVFSENNNLYWIQNNGNNTFSVPQIITGVNGVYEIISHDLDGDLDIDLIIRTYNSIVSLQNDGLGNFTIYQNISTSDNIYFSLQDIDGDTFLDLVIASEYDFTWYKNDGNGIFFNGIVTPVSLIRGVNVTDVNNDGAKDILIYDNNNIFWYKNFNGYGFFQLQDTIVTDNYIRSLHSFDVDADGDNDIVYSADKIYWLENNPQIDIVLQPIDINICPQIDTSFTIDAGNAIKQWQVYKDSGFVNIQNLNIYNGVNSDVLSLTNVPTNFDGYKYRCKLSNGIDTIYSDTVELTIKPFPIIDLGTDITACDSTIITSPWGYSSYLWSTGETTNSIVVGTTNNQPTDFIVTVTNNIGCSVSDTVRVSVGGSYYSQEFYTSSKKHIDSGYGSSWNINNTDINGDGYNDIIICGTNYLYWYENLTNNTFGNRQQINLLSENYLNSVYPFDVDYDGDIDIISISGGSNRIFWCENTNGLGTFGSEHNIGNYTNPASIDLADLNNNGRKDIVICGNNELAWYTNYGGSFGPKQMISDTLAQVTIVISGDIDGDNDNDLICYYNNKIVSFLNNGTGIFSFSQIISSYTEYCYSLIINDIDNDNDLDLIAVSFSSNKIIKFINQGNGVFGNEQIITTNVDGPVTVFMSDLDNDGNKDLLSASYYDNKIAWYKNNGNGTFAQQDIVLINNSGAYSIMAYDINNDGDNDIVASSDNELFWFENAEDISITSQPFNTQICANTDTCLIINSEYGDIMWQVDTGSGFVDLQNSNIYSGVCAEKLYLKNVPINFNGYKYRCNLFNKTQSIYSDTVTLTVKVAPNVDLGSDIVSCDSVILTTQSGYNIYQWSNGIVDTASIILYSTNNQSLDYSVTVTNNLNCSNTDTVNVRIMELLYEPQICMVTVDPSIVKNKIVWETTLNPDIEKYYIYKELTTNTFHIIDSISSDSTYYLDYASSPMAHGDKYKIAVNNYCNDKSDIATCNYHKTINLVLSMQGTTVGLYWDDYYVENNYYVPSNYFIYRGSSPNNLQLYDSLPASFNSYNDLNVSGLYYYMIVIQREACTAGSKSMIYSYSNPTNTSYYFSVEEQSYIQLNIHPNPASTYVQIEALNLKDDYNAELTITDITGKIVKTTVIASVAKQSIDVSKLNSGTYFIEIKGKQLYRGKFIKE